MQCPRRTSELDEEKVGTATKRQTRQQATTRQSRLAVPTRASSDLRLSSATNATYSAPRSRGVTPQRTPHKTPGKAVRSLLFTAEKQKRGGPSDKQWVQEQSHRILERLRDLSVPGLTADFFSRSNGLQHMAIKQFVAIVNYCLHQMSGNRLTIGANYVDDIVNVLQKIHYPNQLNKSWLKTPTTQHSFGHIVMLLDFLIDFVPTSSDDELPFCVDEAKKLGSSASAEEMFQAPDMDFQMKLFYDAKIGFKLWDKNLKNEFDALQQQTCSTLIQKRCGVRDLATMDVELQNLRTEKMAIDKDRASMNTTGEITYEELSEELKKLLQTLRIHQDELKALKMQTSIKLGRYQELKKEVATVDAAIAHDKRTIRAQPYGVDQRNKYLERLRQLKNMQQGQEQETQNLENNYNNRQFQLSLTSNQLFTSISSFNLQIHELSKAGIENVDVESLQIPLVTEEINLDQLFPKLDALRKKCQAFVNTQSEEISKIEQESESIADKNSSDLELKHSSLEVALKAAQSSLQMLNKRFEAERSALNAQVCQLDEDISQMTTKLEEFKIANKHRREELKLLELDNERKMSEIEQQFSEHAKDREQYLDECEAQLEKNVAELEKLEEIVENNQKYVKLINKEIKDN